MSPASEAARLRAAHARSVKAENDRKKLELQGEETERRRGATQRLHNAFGDVLARKVEHVDAQWAVDRYAELGLAACMVEDLGTIRGVLSDLMKHAKEQPQVSDDEQDLLTSAVAQLGLEAVEQAARKAGLEVMRPEDGAMLVRHVLNDDGNGYHEAYTTIGGTEPDEPPLSPGKARLLAALGKAE